MVSVKVASFVGAVALFASAAQTVAHAADMPQLPPVYAAADRRIRRIGLVPARRHRHEQSAGQEPEQRAVHAPRRRSNHDKDFDSAPLFGLGVGYQFNHWFRTDVTGEYRGKANFHGFDIVRSGGHDDRRYRGIEVRVAGAGQHLCRSRHLVLVHAVHRRGRRRLLQHDQQFHGRLRRADAGRQRCDRRHRVEMEFRLGGARRRFLQGELAALVRIRLPLCQPRRRA